MSRVALHYDNGTAIYFNNQTDAIHHLSAQGFAGVVDLKEDSEKQSVVKTRKQLQDLVEKGQS